MGIYRKIPNGYKRLVQRLDSRFRFHGTAGPDHPDRFRFRFHGTVGLVQPDWSRFRFRFHGIVGPVQVPSRGTQVRFMQFFFGGFTVLRFGPVRNLSQTVPVPVSDPSGSEPIRFRLTRSVAIPSWQIGSRTAL